MTNSVMRVALDLEMNQPSGRIIQIGAVAGDVLSGVVHARFSAFINPREPLAPEISKLCGITPETLEIAGTLDNAFAELKRWVRPFMAQKVHNPITWGAGDMETLREQLELEDEPWLFGRRYLDAKTLFSAWVESRGEIPRGGLSASMKKMGLQFEGRKHDAADDAFNTFRIYAELLKRFSGPAQLL